jgi:uncharacterized protein YidB (DUF937 family)
MLEQLLKSALQGLAGSAGNSNPLLQIAASMLSNSGQFGGLQGLIRQFEQAGLGSHVDSWIGTGQNLPVSPEQLAQVLGSGQLQQMAQQAGLDPQALGSGLSQILPQMIDKLTPQGQAPGGGFGDVMGMLGSLMR